MSDTERLEAARRRGFEEGLRDAADEVGAWGADKGHIAAALRAKADRVADAVLGVPASPKEQTDA